MKKKEGKKNQLLSVRTQNHTPIQYIKQNNTNKTHQKNESNQTYKNKHTHIHTNNNT